jgi:riboflavin kinase/FMN adenylyltransferase
VTPVVATLGVFDGFHRGHRAVLARAAERARLARARLVAFTFDAPPRAVLRGETPGLLLTSLGEKIAFLREAEVEEARVLRFDTHLAAKSPGRFLAEHLFAFHPLAAVVVGYNFALGKGRAGSVPFLSAVGDRLGFLVEPVGAVEDGGRPISSSRIREALAEGRVEDAARWLSRPYRVPGRVERGDGRGRTLGFPTANLRLDSSRLRPGRGVYAVRVGVAGVDGLPGVANIGERPTFGGGEERVEVHLLVPAGDLLGRDLRVDFVARLRSERKFKEPNELQRQIRTDVAAARRILHPPEDPPQAIP